MATEYIPQTLILKTGTGALQKQPLTCKFLLLWNCPISRGCSDDAVGMNGS